MAAELRFIILPNEEFHAAIQSFRRTHPGFLPEGKIEGWSEMEGGGMTLDLTIVGGSDLNHVPFHIETHHVVEILVRYCIENNIIIPKAGRKSWLLKDKSIGLRINLRENEVSSAYDELMAIA